MEILKKIIRTHHIRNQTTINKISDNQAQLKFKTKHMLQFTDKSFIEVLSKF